MLLQLIFTFLTDSKDIIEYIVSILKTFNIFYTKVYNEENSLEENNNIKKDKNDNFWVIKDIIWLNSEEFYLNIKLIIEYLILYN